MNCMLAWRWRRRTTRILSEASGSREREREESLPCSALPSRGFLPLDRNFGDIHDTLLRAFFLMSPRKLRLSPSKISLPACLFAAVPLPVEVEKLLCWSVCPSPFQILSIEHFSMYPCRSRRSALGQRSLHCICLWRQVSTGSFFP